MQPKLSRFKNLAVLQPIFLRDHRCVSRDIQSNFLDFYTRSSGENDIVSNFDELDVRTSRLFKKCKCHADMCGNCIWNVLCAVHFGCDTSWIFEMFTCTRQMDVKIIRCLSLLRHAYIYVPEKSSEKKDIIFDRDSFIFSRVVSGNFDISTRSAFI